MGIYFPGVAPNLPTIPSASDFNTVLSSDQNTLDGTHSQHSTSQDDIAGVEEGNQGFPAVQLADAQVTGLAHHQMKSESVEIEAFVTKRVGCISQVVFKPLLSYTGIQSQDAVPLCYRMYFGEYLSFSGTLDCLRADIVDSDTAKERKSKRARRYDEIFKCVLAKEQKLGFSCGGTFPKHFHRIRRSSLFLSFILSSC